MLYFITGVHVLLCVFMIFVILLQPGKDAGMGAALGGGAATSAFGGRGAVTFLGKVTAVCAVAFFVTSLGLSLVGLKTSAVSKAAGVVAQQHEEADKEKAETDAKEKEAAGVEKTNAATVEQGDPTKAPEPAKAVDGPKAIDAVPSQKVE